MRGIIFEKIVRNNGWDFQHWWRHSFSDVRTISMRKINKLEPRHTHHSKTIEQTHVCTQGHPTFAPGVPAQVGEQRRPPGLSAACARPTRLWWPLLAVTRLLEATDTPRPSPPAPPRLPGPSLPPCSVVKTLTPRAGPADTWSPSQKRGTYFSD